MSASAPSTSARISSRSIAAGLGEHLAGGRRGRRSGLASRRLRSTIASSSLCRRARSAYRRLVVEWIDRGRPCAPRRRRTRARARPACRAPVDATGRSTGSSLRRRTARASLADLGEPVVRLALLLGQVEVPPRDFRQRRSPAGRALPASCSIRCRTSSTWACRRWPVRHGRSAASASRSASSWSSSSLPRLSMSSSIARPYFIQRLSVDTPPP